MYSFPIDYVEPVFRPPSEAKSLILPVTNGCSWNKCTFCEMYTQPQKKFRARKPEDVRKDIENAAKSLGGVKRVSSYCLPRNLAKKTVEELKQLREAGLKILYVGMESGDDEVLQRINKGVSFPQGEERFREGFGEDFVPLSQQGLFEEIRTFMEHLELERTVFRSDHASNYLVLKGNLGRDKQKLLDQVNLAITSPGAVPLRHEWQRGL